MWLPGRAGALQEPGECSTLRRPDVSELVAAELEPGKEVDTRQQQQQRRQQYTHTARRQEKKTLGQTNWFCESAGRTGAAQSEKREARCALGTVVKEEGGGEAELIRAGAPPLLKGEKNSWSRIPLNV
ncbi:hypothetical protein ILYODFUR_009745 [Ilyodon furcidens]|uniref:Uncharacterized protein n=1 Tax=Ilyodon furcidens TaxID=33524 RepID=A0ABV0UEQ2_9TELE